MITTEYYSTRSDGVELYRTYSTLHHYIQRNDGVIYEEAIDPAGTNRFYTETNLYIPSAAESSEAQEAIQILLNGVE